MIAPTTIPNPELQAITSPLMRTLFLTNKLPYPPMGGAPLRNWQNINHLMKYGQVGVFYLHAEHEQPEAPPVAPPGVALWRVQTIQKRPFLQKIGRRVRMMGWMLTRSGTLTDLYYSPDAAQALDQLLTEFQPDLVIFEELWLYCYLSVVKRHPCRIIFDAHNAETFLFQQIFKAENRQGVGAKIDAGIRLALIEAIEQEQVKQADQVWACSTQDAELLTTLTPQTPPIHVIPNGVDVTYYNDVRLGRTAAAAHLQPNPHTLIFTASFSYTPNGVAAQFLIETIYPQLKQVYPDCRVLLVGTNPTPLMLHAAQQNPNIVVTGKVPDIRPYMAAASMVIVPLLQGGGTRLKILEAFAAGLPVVSTTKGAEGLTVRDGEHLLIRDTVEDLVAGVCQFWEAPVLAQRLARSAWEFVQAEYAWSAVAQKTDRAIQELLQQDRVDLQATQKVLAEGRGQKAEGRRQGS